MNDRLGGHRTTPGFYKVIIRLRGLMVIVVCLVTCLIVLCVPGYCQNNQDLFREAAKLYSGSDTSGSSLVGGFSAWGIFGGLIFSGIGFIAFMYGKKNAELRPMLLGLALMIYPYFLRGTAALYIAGVGLTAALYFWRE